MAAALSLGGASALASRAPLSLCTSASASARHGRRRHTSARHGRRPSSSKALAVGDVSVAASSSLVSLSATQALLGKVAFGSLLGTTGVYWGKAAFSNRKENTDDSSGSSTSSSKETTTSRPLEQYGVLAANASLFLLLTARWLESGHFPLSNIYESLMFLAWGVLATQMFVERKAAGESGRLLLGALATPTALLAVGGATLALPPELQKSAALVPALKSNWLMMHVTVMMMSYAALMVGSLLAAGFVGLDVYLELTKGADSSSSTAGAIAENESMDGGEAGSAAVAAVGMDGGEAGSAAVATVVSNAAALLPGRGDARLVELDSLSYRSLGLGFALLTVGIISGAVWANEAWGSYWSWDPKETWALICWLVYASYLHTRLVAGWRPRDAAAVGAFGFVVVWICYVGVNLFGVGLHSYGFLNGS